MQKSTFYLSVVHSLPTRTASHTHVRVYSVLFFKLQTALLSFCYLESKYKSCRTNPVNMPLVASTGPVLVRCCQHRPSTGPVLAHNGMLMGKWVYWTASGWNENQTIFFFTMFIYLIHFSETAPLAVIYKMSTLIQKWIDDNLVPSHSRAMIYENCLFLKESLTVESLKWMPAGLKIC